MLGDTLINEIKKAALCWAGKANEIIKRINRPWTVKFPQESTKWGVWAFRSSKTKVEFDLTNAKVIEFYGCDAQGNRKKFTAFGFSEDVP